MHNQKQSNKLSEIKSQLGYRSEIYLKLLSRHLPYKFFSDSLYKNNLTIIDDDLVGIKLQEKANET